MKSKYELIQGECLEKMKDIESESINLILCDTIAFYREGILTSGCSVRRETIEIPSQYEKLI